MNSIVDSFLSGGLTGPEIFGRPLQPGKFIIFDGIDGSGKGTIISLVCELLKYSAIPIVRTKAPGGTDLGNVIRTILFDAPGMKTIDPEAVELLLVTDHVHTMNTTILPALRAGQWVIADRNWSTCGKVYSQVVVNKSFEELHTAYNGHPHDVLFLMDGAPEIFFQRANNREEQYQKAKNWNRIEDAKKLRTGFMNAHSWDKRTVRLHSDAFTPGQLLVEYVAPVLRGLGLYLNEAVLKRLADPTTRLN